jgi:hypothetical protein
MTRSPRPPYSGIAFAGKAGSGKDYFAERVAQVMETCDLSPRLLSFAELLKRETEIVTGLTRGDPAFRAETHRIGDLARAENPNVYVERMRSGLVRTLRGGHIPIVTDVRLRNERDLCQSQGLLLVRVNAPYVDRLAALRDRGDETWILDSTHPTETELDDAEFDLVVVNLWMTLETFRTIMQIVTVWQGETEVVSQ